MLTASFLRTPIIYADQSISCATLSHVWCRWRVRWCVLLVCRCLYAPVECRCSCFLRCYSDANHGLTNGSWLEALQGRGCDCPAPTTAFLVHLFLLQMDVFWLTLSVSVCTYQAIHKLDEVITSGRFSIFATLSCAPLIWDSLCMPSILSVHI